MAPQSEESVGDVIIDTDIRIKIKVYLFNIELFKLFFIE
jgi:hypothetical protein